MSILHLSGEIIVKVDPVLLEQTCIQHPATVIGFPVALRAMVAALHHEDIIALQKQTLKSGYTLEFVSSDFAEFATLDREQDRQGDWMVKFKIRQCKLHERNDECAQNSK